MTKTIYSNDILIDELEERAQADLLLPDPDDEETEETLKALGVVVVKVPIEE